jgi:hypothetical protein
MNYSIGHLTMPDKDDQLFDDEDKAEQAAVLASYDDSVWAVWDNESGDVLSVIWQQQVFTP